MLRDWYENATRWVICWCKGTKKLKHKQIYVIFVSKYRQKCIIFVSKYRQKDLSLLFTSIFVKQVSLWEKQKVAS